MSDGVTIDKLRVAIRIVDKPWGEEQWFAHDNGKYVGKIFCVRRGHRLSLAYHAEKDETIYLVKGTAELLMEDCTGELIPVHLKAGDAIRIMPGTRHRLSALEDVEVIEVSTPEVEDLIRVEDDYGRLGI